MYAILINPETNRILSATYPQYAYGDNYYIVEQLPEGNIADYLYINNEYVYDPLPREEEAINE